MPTRGLCDLVVGKSLDLQFDDRALLARLIFEQKLHALGGDGHLTGRGSVVDRLELPEVVARVGGLGPRDVPLHRMSVAVAVDDFSFGGLD